MGDAGFGGAPADMSSDNGKRFQFEARAYGNGAKRKNTSHRRKIDQK